MLQELVDAAPFFLTGIGTTLLYTALAAAASLVLAFVFRYVPVGIQNGIAVLKQVDPSIEEASSILGGDAQYTFRKVTLPLISPALLAGLIFSFTRHMTSVSAIIFLVSARWRRPWPTPAPVIWVRREPCCACC